ncbi:MAG: recombinase family protein [Bacteroidota bacterium]
MKKYIAYYRVSTKRQGTSGLGLAAQKKIVQRCISNHSGAIINEFSDIESGEKVGRPGLLKAVAACAKHKATLVVSDIDRLSRDGFKVLTIIHAAGVEYIEAKSPYDTELSKELKFVIAKDERKKISERTRNALGILKDKGVQLGNPQNFSDEARIKGSIANRLKALTNDANKRASILINEFMQKNFTLREIADKLNKNGYKTPTGAFFKPMTVSRIHKRSLLCK